MASPSVDISPLFETPHALRWRARRGTNAGTASLSRPCQDRGVITVQTGFSDAGRYEANRSGFGGRTPTIAFCQRIADSGLTDMRALVFNTWQIHEARQPSHADPAHGLYNEPMGRRPVSPPQYRPDP